jgi:hypothetical protein
MKTQIEEGSNGGVIILLLKHLNIYIWISRGKLRCTDQLSPHHVKDHVRMLDRSFGQGSEGAAVQH